MKVSYRIAGGRFEEAADGAVLLYVNPSEAERAELSGRHGIDAHTLHSALDPDEPARLEKNDGHLTVIFKLPRNFSAEDRFVFKVSSAGLFLYPAKLVLIAAEPLDILPGELLGAADTVESVFLNVLLESVRHYLQHLKVINRISEEIETKISVSMENRYLLSLFDLEKSLVYYVNAVEANSVVLERLKGIAEKVPLSAAGLDLLEDILIEHTQCRRQAEINAEILANMMDARVSIVNNNLSILMKNLNVIMLGVMLPTLVVSVFSMNVTLPFQRRAYAFWLVLGLACASLAVASFFWVAASRRLRRR